MATLFTADNSDSDGELKVNTDYAQNYDNFRKKEELNKLKTKYGVDINTVNGIDEEDELNSSSTSSDEDSDGNELNERFEKEFYRTLASLKKKDPSIYNQGTTFFNEIKDQDNDAEKSTENKKKKKEKALFLRDYERKIITERGGKLSDDSEDETMTQQKRNLTYIEEQHALKESFKNAITEEEDEDTELLKPKQKSDIEKQQEEDAYKEWLKGQPKNIDLKEQEELKPLRDFWNDPNLDSNEKFLRDYVLNNKFLNKDSSKEDLDYSEKIHDSDENLSEDEKEIDKQEEFEAKYNFRFEEPDQEFIKRYPRTMENSMRKKDTRRAQKRAELKKRKEEEKLRKKEELKQLKALKRKEIEEKIEKLKEITGNDDIRFNDMDLEGDFDPAEHDRKMTQMFDDEYYAAPEGDIKPEFPDIDEELGIEKTWDDYDPNADEIVGGNDDEYNAPHCEDPNFNMDADYDGTQNFQAELVEGTKKKKRRRRSKFAEVIAKEKPKFDPTSHPSYEEYFDQYYSLDYEDMIGDIPCRFKYRKVVPNNYGLTIEEILMADDRELNKWCSLKKALQYKPEHVEKSHLKEYQQKAQNEALKRKILKSLYTPQEEPEENDDDEATKTEAKKKRRRKKKNTFTSEDVSENTHFKNEINDNKDSTKNTVNQNIETKESVNTVHEDDNTSAVTNVTETKKNKKRKGIQKDSDNIESKKIKTNEAEHKEVEMNTPNTLQNGIKKVEVSESEKKDDKNVKAVSNKSNSNKKQITQKKKKLKLVNKKFNKAKKDDTTDQIASLDASRLKGYGINAKKFKNKLKYGKKKL